MTSTEIEDTPLHQVFRHNMRLLTESLDKNEVTVKEIQEVISTYNDLEMRCNESLGKYTTADTISSFLDNNCIFIYTLDTVITDMHYIHTICVDNLFNTNLIYDIQSQTYYISSYIKVFDTQEKFLYSTNIELLRQYRDMFKLYARDMYV